MDEYTQQPGDGISLLVPFRSDNGPRERNWAWLKRYWATELPGAQVIQGSNDSTPFCKTAAFNDAASRATGDVLVNMDADTYITPQAVVAAADIIRNAEDRRAYVGFASQVARMSRRETARFLRAEPGPYTAPPAPRHRKMVWQRLPALVAFPREAFDLIGGMDEQFVGWGGEDMSWVYALDLLWHPHTVLPYPAYHLWHPATTNRGLPVLQYGKRLKTFPMRWEGQSERGPNAGQQREKLYLQALVEEDLESMRALAAGANVRELPFPIPDPPLRMQLGLRPRDAQFSLAMPKLHPHQTPRQQIRDLLDAQDKIEANTAKERQTPYVVLNPNEATPGTPPAG